MKKGKKMKLEMNKVSVSKLNNIKGAGRGTVPSVDILCVLTTELKTIPGIDCRTFLTKTDSYDRC